MNEKTEEVIKSANEELAKAQDLLSNDKVIQGDIDKELSSLNNIDFILKSIPKASIEKKLEKENKNTRSTKWKSHSRKRREWI
ncbi:hypothetical protein [Streptococcus mitis]|uniref:Conserved domain protein n=1 Tax=Streptococcus mitis SK1073 TaxID=1008452 RepID=F9HDF7_STRMT|nr:hypothetical protein [Streptococcus mitis]EGP65595.1 conserved domain protein [Streptococcus mitis SK1073]